MCNEKHLETIYKELCSSYRAIDDFRYKLLGFLPLATGTGIFLLFSDKINLCVLYQYLVPVGFFGIIVTLGLFMFELFGIKKCGKLIMAGKELEIKLGCKEHGQFKNRPDLKEPPNELVPIERNEPFAAGIIYAAVLSAWVFLALLGYYKGEVSTNTWLVPVILFFVIFAYTLYYDYRLRKIAWREAVK